MEFQDGSINLAQFLAEYEENDAELLAALDAVISEGNRNNSLSHFARRALKRYGDTEETYQRFLQEAEKCVPPLPDTELQTIWRSAISFYKKVQSQPDYVSPEKFNATVATLKPDDYSNVGQAIVLANEYGNELRYSPATDYIRFNGIYWQESKSRAQAAAQELTERQLEEARVLIRTAKEAMEATGASALIATMGEKKTMDAFSPEQAKAYDAYSTALDYYSFVIKRRISKNIAATIKESQPMLEIDHTVLDRDGFLLNTPTGTYDLRKARVAPESTVRTTSSPRSPRCHPAARA